MLLTTLFISNVHRKMTSKLLQLSEGVKSFSASKAWRQFRWKNESKDANGRLRAIYNVTFHNKCIPPDYHGVLQ